MIKLKYPDEIARDKIKEHRPINSDLRAFRVYIPDRQGNVKGLWIDKGKVYRDRLKFTYYRDYTSACKKARVILNNTTEKCISIENFKENKLYFVYRDKIEILKIKETKKTLYKRTVKIYIKDLLNKNKGLTFYKEKGYFKVFSYR